MKAQEKTEFNLTVSNSAVAIVTTEQQSLFCILSIQSTFSLSRKNLGVEKSSYFVDDHFIKTILDLYTWLFGWQASIGKHMYIHALLKTVRGDEIEHPSVFIISTTKPSVNNIINYHKQLWDFVPRLHHGLTPFCQRAFSVEEVSRHQTGFFFWAFFFFVYFLENFAGWEINFRCM